jgi:hypothetical protein
MELGAPLQSALDALSESAQGLKLDLLLTVSGRLSASKRFGVSARSGHLHRRCSMNDFLLQQEYLNARDVVILQCDTQCNFLLLDDANFSSYEREGSYSYYGGFFTHFPARIVVPRSGHWNIVIDLGGGHANIRYGIRIVKAA